MQNLIVGNIFSLLTVICVAVSVIKKNKSDLILWQLWGIGFSNFSCLFLGAYAALITCITDFIRHSLAYKNMLTFRITIILICVCIITGLWINNLGLIGILAIAASASYTLLMYVTKNDQQMRWALVLNQSLWFIHNIYVQAYPSVASEVILTIWTLIQIYRNRRIKHNTRQITNNNLSNS